MTNMATFHGGGGYDNPPLSSEGPVYYPIDPPPPPVIIKLDGLRNSCFHMYPNLQLGHAENVGPFLLRDIQSQEAGRRNRNTLLILILYHSIYVFLFFFILMPYSKFWLLLLF